jgi:DNA-binding HxlR family transcriptional regulator
VTFTASADGRFDVLSAACPTRQVINRIGDRWSLLVLYALENGTLRFQELRRTVDGVSQKMLTQTVRALERDGLIARNAGLADRRSRTISITPAGRALHARVVAEIRAMEEQLLAPLTPGERRALLAALPKLASDGSGRAPGSQSA